MGRVEKTVFISYRHTDTPWALAVFQDLTSHGYDVFFDYTGIASGKFEPVIVENIAARAHFLVLLTPSALEGCADPRDWMRREFEWARHYDRNIVPILLDGFDFDTPAIARQLTGPLAELKLYNALSVPSGFFFEAMRRLREQYLNVPVEAVRHVVSFEAQLAATEQKTAAGKAPLVFGSAPYPHWHRWYAVGGTLMFLLIIALILVLNPATQHACQARPTREAHINLRDGLSYIYIPKGHFRMGCSPNDSCKPDEYPSRDVVIPSDFCIGRTEVTQGAFQRVTGQNPSQFKDSLDNPVEMVTWDEAVDYCRRIGGRLPTEAEWEYAARAGTITSKYGNPADIEWDELNSERRTHPVGKKKPNPWGLYDMLGNVFEWVQGLYPENFLQSTDPRNPPPHIIKGGSWDNTPNALRASRRQPLSPTTRSHSVGFRCVLDVSR